MRHVARWGSFTHPGIGEYQAVLAEDANTVVVYVRAEPESKWYAMDEFTLDGRDFVNAVTEYVTLPVGIRFDRQ